MVGNHHPLGFVAIFVPRRMARLLLAEIKLLVMALFAWGPRRRHSQEPSFTSGSILAPVLLAVATLSIVEITIVRLIVGQRSPLGSSMLTGLGLFMALYMVGLAKSLQYMPTLLRRQALLVRLGHFREVEIPYEAITTVRRSDRGEKAPAGSLDLAPMSAPNLIIGLKSERETVGLGGRVRRYTQIALRMDDAAAFERSLIARLGE
jgi:hypothetical protein